MLVGIDAFDVGEIGRHELSLDLFGRTVIAGGENDAERRTDAAGAALIGQNFDANDCRIVAQQLHRANANAYLDAELPRALLQVIKIRARMRQDIVHARQAVRRLGHGAEEHDAHVHQPLHHVRRMLDQQPPQFEIILIGEAAIVGKQRHVLEVRLRNIVNSFVPLQRRTSRGHRSNRTNGGAAKRGILFEQHHFASEARRFDRRSKAAAAAADDHDIKSLVVLNVHSRRAAYLVFFRWTAPRS